MPGVNSGGSTNCNGNCTDTCTAQCGTGCGDSCSQGCGTACSHSCGGACSRTCFDTCASMCIGYCSASCTGSVTKYVNTALDNGREHRVGAQLYDWEFNDTYDIKSVAKDNMTLIEQLYSQCIKNQKIRCDISRLYGKMSDFVSDIDINNELGVGFFSYTLEVPMQNVRCLKKLALKRANPRLYTVNDTCSKTEIFERRLMLFIDGSYYPDVRFFIDYDRFIMVIEPTRTLTNDKIRAMRLGDVTWSLLIMPFSTTLEFIGNTQMINGKEGATLTKHGLLINNMKMTSTTKFTSKNMWLASVRFNNPITNGSGNPPAYNWRSFSFITNMTTVNGKQYLVIPESIRKRLNSGHDIYLSLSAIPHAKGSVHLDTARAFQIELDKNPIPPENVICWSINQDGLVKYVHNAEVTLHYPNVYEINNVSDEASLFVTWCHCDEASTTFINPLKEYMEYNTLYAPDIINDRIPEAIKAYIPYKHVYYEWHYAEYHRKATRRYEEPLLYSFETLKELLDDDARRLEGLYLKNVQDTAYKWHSNPKYHVRMNKWGSMADRIRRTNGREIRHGTYVDFGMDCVYFVIEHEDDRSYPICVTIDGIRCMNHFQYTEGFRTFVYVPAAFVTPDSFIEFEVMKVRSNLINGIDVKMPAIHFSMELPENFPDISPQNFMIAIREEKPDSESNGGMKYYYKIAPNYEMYWLIFGTTKYINGVPENYTTDYPVEEGKYTDVLTSSDSALLDDKGNALKLSDGNFWYGGEYHYLLEFGDDINTIETPNKTEGLLDEEGNPIYQDVYQVRDLGYYADARRRFYQYMQNDKYIIIDDRNEFDDTHIPDHEKVKIKDGVLCNEDCQVPNRIRERVDPVYITPITSYFAHKNVRMVATDIYRKWTFVIGRNAKGEFDPTFNKVTIDDFYLEPSPNKLRVYMDGRLLDPYTDYVMDASIKNGFYLGSSVNIYIKKKFVAFADIMVEFLPYRYNMLYRLEDVSLTNLQLREAVITRPFSMVYYDVYVNGEKLAPEDVTVVTPSKIIINKELHNDIVSFYERCHDQDIYENDRYMKQALVDAIATEISGFREYLLPEFAKADIVDNIYAPAGCSGTCTTACTTSCTIMCGSSCDTFCGKGCTGSCENTCFNEAGTTACGGCAVGCSAVCYGCAGTCIGMASARPNACKDCSTQCGSSCIGTCIGTSGGVTTCEGCAGNCAGTCYQSCSGTSSANGCYGCGATCMYECSNCTGTCTGSAEGLVSVPEACNGCSSSCGTACSDNCTGTCFSGCRQSCAGCSGSCDNTCENHCTGTCENGCLSDCSGSCSNTSARDASVTSCSGCYASCLGNCMTTNASSTECSGCGHLCTNACIGRCTGSCDSLCRGACSTSCVSSDNVRTMAAQFY